MSAHEIRHRADAAYLADYLTVAETAKAYTRSIDLRDWTRYRSLFGDTVAVDYTPRRDGIPTGEIPSEDWVEGARSSLGRLEATHHFLSTYSVRIDGDRAETINYYDARHFESSASGDPTFTQHGVYRHVLRRVEGRWLIAKVHAHVVYATGNASVLGSTLPGE